MTKYKCGSRWYQGYGNGVRYDTIIKIVDKYYVELAGQGVVSKKYLQSVWVLSKPTN